MCLMKKKKKKKKKEIFYATSTTTIFPHQIYKIIIIIIKSKFSIHSSSLGKILKKPNFLSLLVDGKIES